MNGSGRRAAVELLFPPLFKMDAPYTALPYLAGFLRRNGVGNVSLVDLNVSYVRHLMDRATLAEVAGALADRHAAFVDRAPASDSDLDVLERTQLRNAVGLTQWLQDELPAALDLFARHRSASYIASLAREQAVEEQTRVQLAFDLLAEVYSVYFFPWRIENLLNRREVHFSNDSWSAYAMRNIPWRDQLAALRDPRNPFRDWVRDHVVDGLAARAPDVVGLSLMFREQFLCVFTLADFIRRACPGVHICIGGALLSDLEHHLLHGPGFRDRVFEYADSLVIGPGEVPLFRLIRGLESGESIAEIPNVLTRETAAQPAQTYMIVPSAPTGKVRRPGSLERFEARPPRRVHEAVPPPRVASNLTTFSPAGRQDSGLARHAPPIYFDGDMSRYLYPEEQIIVPYVASQGCYWNKCTFCKYRDQVHSYALVPMDDIVADIRSLSASCDSRRFHLNDEALSPSFCRRFSERLLAERLDIRWSGNARFDPGLTLDVLRLVRASGCEYLSFGLESASENVLALTGKGTRLDVVEQTMERCKAVGLPVCLYLFFGFPGETSDDLRETTAFLARHQGTYIDMSVGPFTLYHSTEVFQEPERFGVRVDYRGFTDPDVIGWSYDFEVCVDGALQPDEAARQYVAEHQRLFGELGPCFSTDGSL